MTNQTHFDAIIIGSGTSAYYCAIGLLEGGMSIAIIDERPFGGTCALRGCQPKKYLVANAEAVAGAAHLVGKGIKVAPETDWAALQKLKNAFLDGIPEEAEANWREKGVATFRQRATLSGANEVSLADGTTLTAEHIILATGSTPRPLDIPGSEHFHTSDDFLELPELPPRITFIGGGYISFEFAHVAVRAGAEVTILHRSAQVLKGFEPDIVDVVVEASRAAGIRIVLETSPTGVVRKSDILTISTDSGESFETDYMVVATGRVPSLGMLAGDAGNVDHSKHGVTVNGYLQSTSNPAVYAIGDCANAGLMLATVADEHGKIAARNILGRNKLKVDLGKVATSVFTIPSMASVGLTEDDAKEAGHDFRVNSGSTTEWPSSKRIGEEHGAYKVLIDNKTGLLLGAHLVRHNAAEVINTFALAIAHDIPASFLAEFLWAYPTSTSDLKNMVR
ncbi:MAG: NAD(P)/FAD-dependent oxidoreductase [Burkholderiaceae bacterium]|nr:NAD(P)/FAD-dependent oxidoreductase [Burkholderiaceae bacterium]